MQVLRRGDIKRLKEHFGGYDPVLGKYSENWVLDHDHDTGFCRGIIDRDVNQFIGKIESAYKRFVKHKSTESLPDILQDIATYLRMAPGTHNRLSAVLHPEGVAKLCRQFSYKNSSEQSKILKGMYKGFKTYTNKELKDMTKAQRLKLYKFYFADESRIFKI